MIYVELAEMEMALISICHLARECVAWLEFPHSVLDETTTFNLEKSVAICWRICYYWSPWVIINVNPDNSCNSHIDQKLI